MSLLRTAGIGGWVLGHPFGPYRIDLAFPGLRVAVEVDRWHLLRFTWHDLDGRPTDTVAEITETLALASATSA